MIIRNLLNYAQGKLIAAGVENCQVDAELLLGFVLNKNRTQLYLDAGLIVSETQQQEFKSLLQRRQQREPIAYILGHQEFWSLDFIVSPAVLIPRPETELLVEEGIAFYKKCGTHNGLLLDLCCGSGIIAVVLAKELAVPVIAADISADALEIAKINAVRHGVSHLINFVHGDLLTSFCEKPVFSMILTNPPYVSNEEMKKGLQPEVDGYEPHLALNGGRGGFTVLQRIQKQISSRLLPGGSLHMEIGAEQGDGVLELFSKDAAAKQKYSNARIIKDYSGHDRILSVQKNQ